MKLVGDHNVPRGRLSFRTEPGHASAPAWIMPIQLQLRDDVSDDAAFWWSPAGHEIAFAEDGQGFDVVGQNPSGSPRGHFHRVTHAEALEAAQSNEDAP